jgi:hypothetical protein
MNKKDAQRIVDILRELDIAEKELTKIKSTGNITFSIGEIVSYVAYPGDPLFNQLKNNAVNYFADKIKNLNEELEKF